MVAKMTEGEILVFFDHALRTNEFFVLYQPQINHSNGTMTGAEAFVRWKHVGFEVQRASGFIPVLEENNLISELDLYVVEQVCRFQRKCLDDHKMAVPIAVNISTIDFCLPDFVEKIEAIRKAYDIPVRYLRIETDGCATKRELVCVKEAIAEFHKKGYMVSLDKFGGRFPSFDNIQELRVDAIKLDFRHFGAQMDERAGIVISSVIKMADLLETSVIGQCVETVQQADFLKSAGCSHVQGYLYAEPLPEDAFVDKMLKLRYEPVAASMHLLDETELGRYFNPDSAESIVFSNFIGGAAVIACEEGKVEILRANRKYIDELGMGITEEKLTDADLRDTFDEENRLLYENAVRKAIETKEEQMCDTWRTIYSKCCGEDNICIRSWLHLLGKAGERYVLFESIQNITAEKKYLSEVEANETKFRFAADQADIFAWEYDVATREMRPCSRCRRELGLPPVVKNYPEPVIESGLFPPDYADMYRDWHRQIAEGAEHLEAVIPLTEKRIPYYVRYTTEFNEAGIPVKAYASATLDVGDEEKRNAISEKEKAQDAMEKALLKAERANAAKTAFLSRMSHDIRTPLNGIIGLLEMDERHPDDREMQKSNREKMKIAADHLMTLINDVLELSKMEDDSVTLVRESFDIGRLVDEVLVISEMRAGNSGITLKKTNFKDNIKYPNVYGSPLHVKRILLNILSNSIKYNVSGGSVTFDMDLADDSDGKAVYRFRIEDTGIGMSAEFLQHVFEPFTQEHYDTKSEYHGTGLGMAIVKSLLDKMKGGIDIQSKEGEGSSFTILIPFDIDVNGYTIEAEETKMDISGAKVLLAEDNTVNMHIASRLLKDAGVVVTKAFNGQEAVDLFAENPPDTFDVILMDILMPVLDGLGATRAIRCMSREDAKSIPIIAMTASAFDEDRKEAKDVGMNDFISKPMKGDALIRKIGQYV